MTEGYSTIENMQKYYGRIENGRILDGMYGAQIPFNFLLLSNTNMGTKTFDYKANIDNWLKNMPKGNQIQANWVVGFRILRKIENQTIDFFPDGIY